jgi:hypothetical protein
MAKLNSPKYSVAHGHAESARLSLGLAIKELERLKELNAGRPIAHEVISLDIALIVHAQGQIPRLK